MKCFNISDEISATRVIECNLGLDGKVHSLNDLGMDTFGLKALPPSGWEFLAPEDFGPGIDRLKKSALTGEPYYTENTMLIRRKRVKLRWVVTPSYDDDQFFKFFNVVGHI